MKEFNPKTASLSTFKRKIDEFWANKKPNIPYTLNDLTNKFKLSNRWRHETYKSKKIVPLLERQINKIESELIKTMVKTHDGVKTIDNGHLIINIHCKKKNLKKN